MTENLCDMINRITPENTHEPIQPLPRSWRVLLDGWKHDSQRYYNALRSIRDFSGADVPDQNLRAALMTVNDMAQEALEHGGEE